MHQVRGICLWIVLFGGASTWAAEPALPEREAVMQQLRGEHPRLLATQADFDRLRSLCKSSDRAGQWLEQLEDRARKLLAQPPVKYEIPDGKRLLKVCRRAKDRLLLLGLMYQITGDQQFADRAWSELAAVTDFDDWNPSHFLDTAEMTFAVAVGYDWLYDTWTEEQRRQLREAIIQKGLQPGLIVYRNNRGWSKSIHNWNQVCNGGMAVGALAIGDEEPVLAGEVLHAALRSLPRAMHEFRPDGGWGEGPGYWRYATEYNVYCLAALRTALGTDFDLAQMPGFAATGDFPIYLTSPSGLTFNFADAHDGWRGAPQLFWLASAFDQPVYAQAQLPYASARPSALDLLWGAAWADRGEVETPLPLARQFAGVSVVTMRGAWDDPETTFVAFKGGDNGVNHGHLDLGSFVLDAWGQRWAIDLGPDDYNLPGYFGRDRWKYYRNNTQSHNTLVINGENQSPAARSAIVQFAVTERWAGAIADLSAAWPQAKQVRRGVALIDRLQVLVQDEVVADKPIEVAWQMLTDAEVGVENRVAILKKGNRQITARLLSPSDGRWEVVAVQVKPPERPVRDVRKLVAVAPEPVSDVRFAVVFDVSTEPGPMSDLMPLSEWPGDSN